MNIASNNESFEVAKAIKNGDFAAFNALYSESYPKLLNFVYKMAKDRALAEDVVQETFFILWNKRESINPEMPINGFLYKISHNEFLKHIRKQTKEKAFLDEIKANQYLELYAVDESPKRLAQLKKIIEELSPKCKEAFMASKYDNLTYAEIAERMGISKKTVEIHISKAYSIIRQKIKLINYLF